MNDNYQAPTREPGWTAEMDLADRMSKTLRVTGIGVSEIAGMLQVRRETVGTWINGRITPKRPALLAWASITGCDLTWLETGQVPGSLPTPDVVELPRLDSNQQPSGYPSALVSLSRCARCGGYLWDNGYCPNCKETPDVVETTRDTLARPSGYPSALVIDLDVYRAERPRIAS